MQDNWKHLWEIGKWVCEMELIPQKIFLVCGGRKINLLLAYRFCCGCKENLRIIIEAFEGSKCWDSIIVFIASLQLCFWDTGSSICIELTWDRG